MIKNKIALPSIFLAVALFASACGSSDKAQESATTSASAATDVQTSQSSPEISEDDITPVDVGYMDDNTKYINETLGFEIQLPKDWSYLNSEEMDLNNEMQIEQNPSLAEVLPYTTNLVLGYDAQNLNNGNLIQITAETIHDLDDPKAVLEAAKADLETAKKELLELGATSIEISEVEEVSIDNHPYYKLSTTAPVSINATDSGEDPGTSTSDMYITKLDDTTFLKLNFMYSDNAGKEAIKTALDSFKYTK